MKQHLLENWPAILLAIFFVSFILSRVFREKKEVNEEGKSKKKSPFINVVPIWVRVLISFLKLLPWIIIIGVIYVTYWPLDGGNLWLQNQAVVFNEETSFWVREKGLNSELFGAVVVRAQQPRNIYTGRPEDDGSTIDPWTVYSIYYGETSRNSLGCDPRQNSVCGSFIAYNAIGVRFSRVWEKNEAIRQRKALETILAQDIIQKRYPGISIENARGSSAGAIGVCQGMPWQITDLMGDWIEQGIFDPWGDPESIAEFTIRYLIRAYAKGGREASYQSYNPGGPTWYFEVLRKNASNLETSYQSRFGSSQVVATIVDQKTDTWLLRALAYTERLEAKTKIISGLTQKVGLGDAGWLLKVNQSASKFFRSWSALAYGGASDYIAGTTLASEARAKAPLAHDVQAVLSLSDRPDGADGDYAKNIRWVFALRWMKDQNKAGAFSSPHDLNLERVDIYGKIDIEPSQEFDFVKYFGCFCTAEGYLTWRGIPGAGACDLATAFNHLALLTPGLEPWHGEQHASQIRGFSLDESVNIWIDRDSANLKIKNVTESPITIYWRVGSREVQLWTGITQIGG